ncbi:cytochrome P450 [Minicystis rosea]|nr:cytochrome P450 [Minicystis rosea]
MTTRSPFASLAGPPPMPFFGWRGNMVRFFQDTIGYMAPLARRYGDVVSFAAGGSGAVLVRQPESRGAVFAFGPACHQAVLGQMSVFHSTRVPGPPESRSFARITSGLFNMNDDKHRQQRRLMQPAFHRKRLDGYLDTMVRFTADVLDGFRVGETRDLVREMERLTLAVANKTLFGLEPTPGVISLGERIQEVIGRSMSPGALVPINLPGSPRRKLIEAADRVDAELRAVIATKRASGIDGDDVLSTLIATRDEAGDALADDELIGQTFILFLAGHDTTKSALAWTLFLLEQHPRIFADVLDELRGVLRGAAPTVAQLGELPLLERVIKESLRLLPPAPLTARLTMQPTALGGVELPAGTEVIISPYCLHRYPDLYTEAQRFLPDRWASIERSPFEYAPFGAGARMCIGAAFAMMELKTVLSMFLQRFGVGLAKGATIDRRTTVVMAPRYGMPMILRPPGAPAEPGVARGNVREMIDLPQ